MCCKSMTWDQLLYFPSEGSHTQDFDVLKKSIDPGRVEPTNLRSSGEYDNHWGRLERDKNIHISTDPIYSIINVRQNYHWTSCSTIISTVIFNYVLIRKFAGILWDHGDYAITCTTLIKCIYHSLPS